MLGAIPPSSLVPCPKCTFLNPSSSKSTICQICLSPLLAPPPPPPVTASSSSSTLTWPCKKCTFLNPFGRPSCDICGARNTIDDMDDVIDVEDVEESVFYPLKNKGMFQMSNGGNESVGDGDLSGSQVVGMGRNVESLSIGNAKAGASDLDVKMARNEKSWSVAKSMGKSLVKVEGMGRNEESLGVAKGTKPLGKSTGFKPMGICAKSRLLSMNDNKESTTASKRVNDGLVMDDFGDLEEVPEFTGLKAKVASGFPVLKRCNNKNKRKCEVKVEKMNEGVGGLSDLGKFCGAKSSSGSFDTGMEHVADETTTNTGSGTFKIMTYNVWFREDLELFERMEAIGFLILQNSPDLICFQEVTPDIYTIFHKSCWWKQYRCSLTKKMASERGYFCMQLSKVPVKSFSCKPFDYTKMGRELCLTEVEVGSGKPLVVATSHLESPCPGPPTWDQMFSKERVAQAEEAITFLNDKQNAIFCGDMNWDDKSDGPFPISSSWVDPWIELRPGEDGFTYDTKTNLMISGNRSLRKRLDRFLCKLPDFRITGINMIGMEEIPGLSHIKKKKVKGVMKDLMLPVLPSDHYGLLLTISSK